MRRLGAGTGYQKGTVMLKRLAVVDPGVTLVNKPYRREELLGKVRALLDDGDD